MNKREKEVIVKGGGERGEEGEGDEGNQGEERERERRGEKKMEMRREEGTGGARRADVRNRGTEEGGWEERRTGRKGVRLESWK